MTNSSSPRASKRAKLDCASLPADLDSEDRGYTEEQAPGHNGDVSPHSSHSDSFEDHCSICLHQVVDRTIVPICSHEFCFECLIIWCDQSRRCPLCSQAIGDHVIHQIRSSYDYQKHYLPPLKTNSPKPLQARGTARENRRARPPRRERRWGREEETERREKDRMELAIKKRRWVYENDLYAKHVASNGYTRFRSYPTPAQFAASPDMISRVTMFLRRELQVWVNLDVEFLTTYTISLMKAIDLRSESAVKLLAEFLDMDGQGYSPGERHRNAEHFAHEVYSFARSPYRDLGVYDGVVQYDAPATDQPPEAIASQRQFWPEDASREDDRAGPSRRRSPSPQPRELSSRHSASKHPPSVESTRRPRRRRSPSSSRDRDVSWSPSGRNYPSTRGRYSDSDDDGYNHSYRDATTTSRGDLDAQVQLRQNANATNEPSTPLRGDRDAEDVDLDCDSGKGKQRQVAVDAGDPTPPARQEIQIKGKARQLSSTQQDEDEDLTTKTNGIENANRRSDVGRQADNARHRRVDLLQSVQDHLKLNGAGGLSAFRSQHHSFEMRAEGQRQRGESYAQLSNPSETTKIVVDEATKLANGTRPSSPPPALLARLSDPSKRPGVPHGDAPSKARTRVMKIVGSNGLGPSASNGSDLGAELGVNAQNGGGSASGAGAGRRALLLERLEQEKRRAQLDSEEGLSINEPGDLEGPPLDLDPVARDSSLSGTSGSEGASSVSRAEFLRAQLAGAKKGRGRG